MKKYRDYFYTTRKNIDGEYKWYLWGAKREDCSRECLEISEDTYPSKSEAIDEAIDNIDEYYY